MKKRLIVFCSLMIFIYNISAPAQTYTRVTKQAKGFTKNPALTVNPISGNPQLAKLVDRYLRYCGWFDVQTTGGGDYSLSGAVSGGVLVLTVYNRAGLVYFRASQPVSGDLRQTAAAAVDKVLRQMFKVPGICSSRIVFCVENNPKVRNIYTCGMDGAADDINKITSYQSMCVEPEWLPDGKSIVYTRYGSSFTNIVQTNLNPLKTRILAAYSGLNSGASVSPNGKYLAFVTSQGKMVDLYVKTLTGKSRKRLTNNNDVEATPCWSPGGGNICFVSDRSGSPKLYIVSVNNGSVRSLPTLGTESVCPSWSKDNKIVYAAKMGGNYAIALLDLNDSSNSRILVSAAGDWESPSWAPDDRHVVCSRTYGGKSMLYVIDTWTGNARVLLRGANNFTMPNWSNVN